MPGLFGPAGQQPYPDPVILLCQKDNNHAWTFRAGRTATISGSRYFIVPVGQQPCLDFSGRQDSNHIRIPLFYCARRTTTMPGLFGPAGQQPYPDPVILLCQKDNNHAWTFRAGRTATISGSRYFIVPVGQQPCLDFSGRQDSNHIRIPLFYCASRTTTMPGLFGPAGQQPYPDPVYFIYMCRHIHICIIYYYYFGSNGASIMKNAWNMILLIVPLEV